MGVPGLTVGGVLEEARDLGKAFDVGDLCKIQVTG